MASSTITWVPAGGTNSLSQTVQYKLKLDSVWTTSSTVAAGVATATVSGLVANTLYDFRIVDNCAVGGAIPSASVTQILFICPEVTLTPTFEAVTVAFANLYADISKYVIQLFSADGSTLLGTIPITDITPSTFSNIFTGLAASTSYNIRVTIYAGSTFMYNHICPMTLFATGTAPICGVPGSVTAVMS